MAFSARLTEQGGERKSEDLEETDGGRATRAREREGDRVPGSIPPMGQRRPAGRNRTRGYSNDLAAILATARNGAGQTPRTRATAAVTASAKADIGVTFAHASSPVGSLMYIATTTRR